jgi:hypothetical protein
MLTFQCESCTLALFISLCCIAFRITKYVEINNFKWREGLKNTFTAKAGEFPDVAEALILMFDVRFQATVNAS